MKVITQVEKREMSATPFCALRCTEIWAHESDLTQGSYCNLQSGHNAIDHANDHNRHFVLRHYINSFALQVFSSQLSLFGRLRDIIKQGSGNPFNQSVPSPF